MEPGCQLQSFGDKAGKYPLLSQGLLVPNLPIENASVLETPFPKRLCCV